MSTPITRMTHLAAPTALIALALSACHDVPTSPTTAPDPVIQLARGGGTSKARIAFISTRDHPNGEVYTMAPDGTDVVRLTFDTWHDYGPTLSPDGKSVAYASKRGPGDWTEIIVVDVQTLAEDVVVNTGDALSPTWSPDGSLLAFRSDRDLAAGVPSEIYVVPTYSGRAPLRITANMTADDMPAWSPDGDWLAVSRRSAAGDWFIAAISYPTGTEYHVTPDDGSIGDSHFSPTWSHDGTQIAFGMSPLGSGPSVIQVRASNGRGAIGVLSNMDDSEPDWSKPKGSRAGAARAWPAVGVSRCRPWS